jgi:hypothetical protein
MTKYEFELIDRHRQDPLPPESRRRVLDRPWVQLETSLKGTASCYRPDAGLENAINTAITVGEPLLLTGEPGTGKTQAAYFVAHQLGVEIFHFQVKSNTTAGELLAWLQVLSVATDCRPEVLDAELKNLPYLGTLIKHPEDLQELKRST